MLRTVVIHINQSIRRRLLWSSSNLINTTKMNLITPPLNEDKIIEQVKETIKLLYTTKPKYPIQTEIDELVIGYIGCMRIKEIEQANNDLELIEVMQKYHSEELGLVYKIVCNYLSELTLQWPFRSHNPDYPVPCYLPNDPQAGLYVDPKECFYSGLYFYDPETPYGRARLNLLEFLYKKTQLV